jgi:hypothetical protein
MRREYYCVVVQLPKCNSTTQVKAVASVNLVRYQESSEELFCQLMITAATS